jgi:hypothetical protein
MSTEEEAANAMAQQLTEAIQAGLAAATAGAGSSSAQGRRGLGAPTEVREIATRPGVISLTKLDDLPRDPSNPVPRKVDAPTTASLLDLALDRGFLAVRSAGSKGSEYEYRHHASYLSYTYDVYKAFEAQLAREDQLDKKSLEVIFTHLECVVRRVIARLDYLKIRGEMLQSDPGLVYAIEQTISGVADLPVSSGLVLDTIADYRNQTVRQAVKLGASQGIRGASGYMDSNGGGHNNRGGRGGRGGQRGGRGGGRATRPQSEERGLGPYNLRGGAGGAPPADA